MIKRARELRNNMTDAEQRLWREIRRDRLGVRFRRQTVFDQRYILDFYAPSVRLAIEVDGAQHVEQAPNDRARTAYLAAREVCVLRFWNNQVLKETKAVVTAIHDAIVALTTNANVKENRP